MKCLLVFGALSAFLMGFAKGEWDQKAEDCATELKLDKEAMKKLYELDIRPEDNSELNKLVECSWKKEGTMRANGEVDWKKVDEVLEKEFQKQFGDDPKLSEIISATIIVGAVHECKELNIKGDSPGQLGIKIGNCFSKKSTEIVEAAKKKE